MLKDPPTVVAASNALVSAPAGAPARLRWLSSDELGLIGWSALMGIMAALATSFVPGAWYARLALPDWAPPGWLFGPLWTALYVGQALAAWVIWRQARQDQGDTAVLTLFGASLVLDALWPWLFFSLHHVPLALVDASLLAVVSTACVLVFWLRQPLAGVLLAPSLVRTLYIGALCAELLV